MGQGASRRTQTERLADELVARLRELGDPARREATLAYFPSRMENLGVSVPSLRKVAREIGRRLRGAPGREVLALGRAVLARGTLEGRQAAYEIVARHPGALAAVGLPDLRVLGRGMDNWGSVDGFSVLIAGPAWREGRLEDREIERWARSRDRWWRRAALVSTVALNARSRGGRGDPRRTLRICAGLVGDRDDMVVKALSWALRELAKVEPAAARAFLEEHRERIAPRVAREVKAKLETGRKNPGRAAERR